VVDLGHKIAPVPLVEAVGIPVIMDRCHQNLAKNALEPEREARFGSSPGPTGSGRAQLPGRDRGDLRHVQGPWGRAGWTLDAGLAAAFGWTQRASVLLPK